MFVPTVPTEQQRLDAVYRDLFFSRLLGGGPMRSRAALMEDAALAKIEMPYPYFVVVTAQPIEWGSLFDLDETQPAEGTMDRRDLNFVLRNVMEDGYGASARVYAAEYRGQITAVINLPELPEAGVRGVVWDTKQIAATLEEEMDLTVIFAVSRVYRDILDVCDGYTDAQNIFDYLQTMGQDRRVTCYDELTHTEMPPSATKYLQMESKMLSCIQVSDYEGLRRILHELVASEFRDAPPTIEIFRFRICGIVNSLLYMMTEISGTVSREFFYQLDAGPRLCNARTMNRLMVEVDQLMDELSAYAAQQKKGAPPVWLVNLKRYVDENFSDMEVTVAAAADKFGVGASHCSREFKQRYGVGLFDYIQRLRLEKAKSLLGSGLSVKTIALQSGFSSGLTMNRAFKRYEGTTPTKFRDAALEES